MIIQIEPWLGEEEKKQLNEVSDSGWVTEHEKTEEFEKKFCQLTNITNAIAYCNGTMTLLASLKILGIGDGDEVILPDITFTATSNAVIFAGATPVFVDVDKETFQISPSRVIEKITPRTKAIIPVHLYGQSCDMDAIMKIANQHNLNIIEDAAQAVGVKFNGKNLGTFGEFGSFSFFGNKNMTTGEGGMLVTKDLELAKKAYSFKNHGRMKRGTFIHEDIGLNCCITEMQAGIGIAQLNKYPEIIRRKNQIFDFYKKELSGIRDIKFQSVDARCEPIPWFTNIIVPDANALEEFLKQNQIQTRRIFYPLHLQPCYKNLPPQGDFPSAEFIYKHGLSLPSAVTLTQEQLKTVASKIKEFYGKND
jgi:perosamine synthetase